MNHFEIQEVAARFRKAIEKRHKTLRLSWLWGEFPTGCCRDASDMLGTLLRERYAVVAELVRGELGKYSHAWLRIGRLIVDITADQFSSHFPGVEPVIVTSASAMHAQFREIGRCEPQILGFGDLENEFAEDARLDYEDIVSEFESLRDSLS